MSALKVLTFYAFLFVLVLLPGSVFAQFDLGGFGGSNSNSLDSLGSLGGIDVSSITNGVSSSYIPSFGEIAPGVGGLFSTLTLIPRPGYPGPFEEFEVELSAPDGKYSGAIIKWYINGEEEISARNKRKHSFTTGAIGEVMDFEVVLNLRNGSTEKTTMVINPVQIDIILEGLTTVPSFYKGRPLASRQSPARAVAVIGTGKDIHRESLSYDWRINGKPLAGGSIRGLMGINFDMTLDKTADITVTVSDQNGVLGKKTIPLKIAEPQIMFYEENPLRGVVQSAIDTNHQVAGNQVIVRAEPYYLTPYLENEDFLVEWKLSGRVVDNTGSDEPNVIVMRGSGSNSNAGVSFQIVNKKVLGQALLSSFRLRFGN